MEESEGSGFDDFSVEMSEFEVKKKVEWNFAFWNSSEGGSIDNKPVVHNGMVFFGSCNHFFYALDARTGRLVWKFQTHAKISTSYPVLYNNTLIFGSFDQNLYCLDADTGKMKWKFRTRGEISSMGAVHEGVFFFTCRDMMIYAVDCESGSLVWKYKTYGFNVSAPTVYKGMVFFGSADRNLYCLDCKTGSLLWKFETNEEFISVVPFVIHDDVIYFGNIGSVLYAMNVMTREILWKYKTGIYGLSRGGLILGGTYFQPTNDGELLALSLDGKLKWKVTKNEAMCSISTDGERIFQSCEDHHMYCYDTRGNELWKFKTFAPIWHPATEYNGTIFFGSYDCNLYNLDSRTGKLLWKYEVPGGIVIYPDLKDFFEVRIVIPKSEIEDESRSKRYEFGFTEEDAGGTTYKSHITYRMSSQYAAKGKYQKDSDEEAL
jgi:outer membrane protein assembly factor BamB